MEGVQSTLNNYFDPSAGLSSTYKRVHEVKHKSKRVQKAVDTFRKRVNDQNYDTSDEDEHEDDDDIELSSASPRSKKQKRSTVTRTSRSRNKAK